MNDIYESTNYDFSFRGVLAENNELKLFTNNNYISINSDVHFDINGDEKSSINYFACSLLGGIIHTLLNQAKLKNIDLEEIEGKIYLTLKNPLTLLGVRGYIDEPFISDSLINIYLYADIKDEDLIAFCEDSLKYSYIYNTLKSSINIKINFIPIV